MNKITTVVLLAAMCFATGSVQAQRGNRPAPMTFADMDKDKDGFVSEKEFSAAQANRVTQMANEGRRMQNIANRPAFKDFDTDGDGKLSPAEFVQKHGDMQAQRIANRPAPMIFSDMDTDNNREISEQEFNQAQAKRVSQMANEGRRMKNIANRPAFKDFDKNGDGKITTDEFVTWQDEMRKNNNCQ